MGKEQQQNFDLVQRVKNMSEQLSRVGIEVPTSPDSRRDNPRQWLLRGETSVDRLIKNLPFSPQSGKLGSKGVFLGDCTAPLMLSDESVMYVFPSSISSGWLNLESRKFLEIMNEFAKKYNLDTSRIGEGSKAMELVYEKYSVYSPKEGICTVPYQLTIQDCERILLPERLIDQGTLNQIDQETLAKILLLKF